MDNNALFLSGYNRNTLFADNEFVWLGLSAMAGWGYTDEMDGTDGQQPRFTRIERNYVHEIGIVSTALTATALLCSLCRPARSRLLCVESLVGSPLLCVLCQGCCLLLADREAELDVVPSESLVR